MCPQEFLESMPEVCDPSPPEQAEVLRAAYGLESPEGSPDLDPALADQIPPVPEDASTAELMEHYATVINISHSIEEAGDTIYIDQSVNQNIEAYGDVNQNFDQAAVTGDGAVLAGDGSQVNTGEGAVQAGGDVNDSTRGHGRRRRLGDGRQRRLDRGRRQRRHQRLRGRLRRLRRGRRHQRRGRERQPGRRHDRAATPTATPT